MKADIQRNHRRDHQLPVGEVDKIDRNPFTDPDLAICSPWGKRGARRPLESLGIAMSNGQNVSNECDLGVTMVYINIYARYNDGMDPKIYFRLYR